MAYSVEITVKVRNDTQVVIKEESIKVEAPKEVLPSIPWAQNVQELMNNIVRELQAGA